ncbi:Nucleotidyltransferase domain-containing protein [Epilithonimonas bovis DSM 19482]|uniref:Nucleotidyltransferase domain-containing protein n=1 Tax=Epilithonimonas bovis DSM 19482 TaxID=1121284 RepID=A0A1U7PXD0_9FLAO|nr:Nucleotidyltransferase domain-containing protein [Epilithonimonas bovis DSM 19482]
MESKEICLNDKIFGLSKKDILKIYSVFEKYSQVDKVIIFGSRVKGNYKPYSDIDLTLIGENLSQKILYDIQLSLDDLLLPYIFDINIKEKITNPELIDHINRLGEIFFERINLI